MNKVSYEMKASVKEVYDVMILSVLTEAQTISGKEYSQEDLKKGFKYKRKKKQGKKEFETITHVRKPIEYKNIHLSVEYPTNTYEMDYTFEAIDDSHCRLNYTQGVNNDKEEKKNFLFNFNMKRKFKSIEKYIIQNRKKEEK